MDGSNERTLQGENHEEASASVFMANADSGAHSTVIDIEGERGAVGGMPTVEALLQRMAQMDQLLRASQAEMASTRSENHMLAQRLFNLQTKTPASPLSTSPNPQLQDGRGDTNPPRLLAYLAPSELVPIQQSCAPHAGEQQPQMAVPQPSHSPGRMQHSSPFLVPTTAGLQLPQAQPGHQQSQKIYGNTPYAYVQQQNIHVQPAYVQQQQQRLYGPQYAAPPPAHATNNVAHDLLVQKPFDLPEFNGQPEEWPVFIAAYHQSTQAFGYGPLQNLFRLQKCLKGEASNTVRHLLTDPLYIEAILDELEFRFGRPDQLVHCQMELIKQFKPIEENQIHRYTDYSSLVQNVCAYLNKDASRHLLGETALMSDLVWKLPPSKQLQWAEHSMTLHRRATAVEFSAWLRNLARSVIMLPRPITSSAANGTPPRVVTTSRQHSNPPQNRHVYGINHQAHSTTPNDVKRTRSSFANMNVADRWETARRERLCFGCLRSGHSFADCRSKRKCDAAGCELFHDNLLHQANSNEARNPVEPAAQPEHNPFRAPMPDIEAPVFNCRDGNNLPLLFRIVPVTLYGPKGACSVFALLDEGSSLTILETSIADQLGLDGPARPLMMQFVGNYSSSEPSRVVSVQISGTGANKTRHQMNNVRTKRSLNLPMQSINMCDLDSRYRHLRHLPVDQYTNATPQMLIGLEHADLGAPSTTRMGPVGSPIACKTKLGWVIFGRQGTDKDATVGRMFHCSQTKDERFDEIERLAKDFYSTENFGVKHIERTIESDDDARARQILERTTVRSGPRFQTGLLWKSDLVEFPDSFRMAQRRLSIVIRKMSNDPDYNQLYQKEIDGYVKKGYARVLSTSEANNRDSRTWYLPHFGVRNVHKPGKLRIVFDAAAQVSGTSMNSMLLKGPDMNEPMTDILFRFRLGAVAVCGDIAEMFHQVEIQPEDRRSQRFLWIDENQQLVEYEMSVMTFGATCSPASAQFVKNKNADDFSKQFPTAAKAIKESHYVDDYVASYATETEAAQVTRDVVEIHRRGGFTLRKIISNSEAVVTALGSGGKDTGSVDMQLDSTINNKILGLRWRTDDDVFYFTINFPNVDKKIVEGTRKPTKRELLSAIMSVYDPFGFLCEFMLPVKILLQELWRIGIQWDDVVPETIDKKWQTWLRDVPSLSRIRIPRCYSPHMLSATYIELHVFADASEEAFSAVAYWRIQHGSDYDVSFIAGKTRCAPLKILSIPRLELQAAVLAVRLTNTIVNSHRTDVNRTVMWSDSQTVLHWIRSEQRRYKPFVAHRVAEITDVVGSACWRWIPTNLNVADDATRIRTNQTFDENSRWIRGPAFLREEEDKWPIEPTTDHTTKDDEEIRNKFVGLAMDRCVVDANRFSDYLPLCRTVAMVLRFAYNAQKTKEARRYGEASAAEMKSAEMHLFRVAQMEGFRDEYKELKSGRQIDRSSNIAQLMPYLDSEGVMRLYGRTDLADAKYLTEDARRPILLPKVHRITELLVRRQHAQMAHQLEDATICAIRQRFWIPHLRTLVRHVKSSCLICKIRAARPKPPVEGQLPVDRLTPYSPPFTYTGVDLFGPINVTIGRRHEKRWIAIFTCLTIRAVHMEVVQDLSSDAFLLCLRNFCNTRGIPNRIRSDCGTNFVGADGELRKLSDFLDTDKVGRELTAKGIDWKFNCPANPEAGGVWERLVQSAKRVLRVILQQIAPRVETLRSMVIEAANILNARPLTHIPVSPTDLSPITPNHFLLGRTNSTTMTAPEDPKQMCSRKQWRVLQQLNNQFWRKWVNDYLPELTRRTKYHEEVGPITPGCLVLVCDANKSRNQWERGRVVEVIIGTDGRVRTATIQTKGGTMRRPVSKLAILDVDVGEPGEAGTHGARDVADS